MKRLTVIALAAILALALAAPATALGSSERPWTGSSVGQTWFDVTNPKGCPAGITTMVTQPAIASHVGLAYLVMSHCPTGDPADNFAASDFLLVAANGDAIFGTYTGTLDVYVEVPGAMGAGTLDLTITGGDGRFEGATGSAVMKAGFVFEGYDDLSWPWWATWRGTLDY